VKPNAADGKTGYKRKITNTENLWVVRSWCGMRVRTEFIWLSIRFNGRLL
jgi:hypothetical protein